MVTRMCSTGHRFPTGGNANSGSSSESSFTGLQFLNAHPPLTSSVCCIQRLAFVHRNTCTRMYDISGKSLGAVSMPPWRLLILHLLYPYPSPKEVALHISRLPLQLGLILEPNSGQWGRIRSNVSKLQVPPHSPSPLVLSLWERECGEPPLPTQRTRAEDSGGV